MCPHPGSDDVLGVEQRSAKENGLQESKKKTATRDTRSNCAWFSLSPPDPSAVCTGQTRDRRVGGGNRVKITQRVQIHTQIPAHTDTHKLTPYTRAACTGRARVGSERERKSSIEKYLKQK